MKKTPKATSEQVLYRRAKIADLHEDDRNARRHGKKNLQSIRQSMEVFGQVEPLVVQAGTGKVIGGNGRLSVMRDLGWTECQIAEVSVDDQQASALGLALNRTAELAEWDESVLCDILKSIDDGSLLQSTGFDEGDIESLFEASEASGSEPDEVSIQAPVKRVWCLIVVPISAWQQVSEKVEQIAAFDDAVVEISATE